MPFFTKQVSQAGELDLVVMIAISMARSESLTAAGEGIPPAQTVRAILDTGASLSAVDPKILSALNLSASGSVLVNTPTTGAAPVDVEQYDVSIVIPIGGEKPLIVTNIPVVKSDLSAQGIGALIGRDVLRSCLLTLDGRSGIFSLAY